MVSTSTSNGNLPTSSMKKRKSEVSLERVIKLQQENIQKEIADFKIVEEYFTKTNSGSNSFVMGVCSQHIKDMNAVIQDIRGNVVISFFAKPGYGKSYMINNIVSGFNKRYDAPLPAGKSSEKGLTTTVIDVMYGEKYELVKVMCTHDEYLLRLKIYNNKAEKKLEPNYYQYTKPTEIIDKNESLKDEDAICKQAHQKIAQFEAVKSEFECLTVKKLILYLPSKFLLENKIIVRDMPGYDEETKYGLYSQYIKESMEDTCILMSGVENARSILDSGLVEKFWKYGIYSPKQLFTPTIVVGINDKGQNSVEIYESTDLVSDYDIMKNAFKDQVANFFDVFIEGVQMFKSGKNEETNIIENKDVFVNNLHANFGTLAFPPKYHKSEIFEKQFLAQVEQARLKIIDNNREKLRDIAIIVLSNILSKTEKESNNDFKKKLAKVKNKILESLNEKMEQTKTVSPTFELLVENNESYSAFQFVTALHNFFKKGIDECFNSSDLEELLEKNRKSKFKNDRKAEWENIFDDFQNNFLEIVDTMKTNANDLIYKLHAFLKSKLPAIEAEFGEVFVKGLINALDPENEEEIGSALINEIREYVVDYEENLSKYLMDTEKIENLNSSDREKIKTLLEQYKKNRPQSKSLEITLNTKLQNPQLAAGSGLKFPLEESKEVSEIKSKEYVSSIDPVMTYSLSKCEKSRLSLSKDDTKKYVDNEIGIAFNWNSESLSISYSENFAKESTVFKHIKKNGKDQEAKEKKLSDIKLAPIFLITRPRGSWSGWCPNLMVNEIQELKAQNVQFLFFIVTERCYLERYKNLLGESGAAISNYKFLILEESTKIGYARVETCVFLTCQHLGFESAIIMHDDIRIFYEYLHDQKITTPHNFAMSRSCLQLEDTLYEELFSPKQISEVTARLATILNTESLSCNIISLYNNILNFETNQKVAQDKCTAISEYFLSLKNPDSREKALIRVAQNPNQLIEYAKIANLTIVDELEKVFDRTQHVGRVSLYDYQTKPTNKNKVLGLSKPTHTLSYSKSSVHIYYIPAMKGIHSISDEQFWKKPDDQQRKEFLKKQKESKKNKLTLCKEASIKGFRYSDIFLKTQMLYYAVASFQLFSFAFASNSNAPSLNDYKDTKRGDNFDSDQEKEPSLEDNVSSSNPTKKRKRNGNASSSKKSKK